MRRRTMLSLTAGGLTMLAGCSGSGNGDSGNGNGNGNGGSENTDDGSNGDGSDDGETSTESSDDGESEPDEEPEPEPEPTFEVRSLDAPSEVQVGESWGYTITVENTSDVDGTYEGTLEVESPAFSGTESQSFTMAVPAGETATRESDTVEAAAITEFTISLEGMSTTVQIVTAKLAFGDAYDAPNDIVATVHGVDLRDTYEYEGYDGEPTTEEASSGQQFAFVDVSVANESGSSALLPFNSDLTIRVESQQFDAAFINREQGKYEGGEVGPGTVREGWIAYEIPDDLDADELTIEWFDTTVEGDHGARWADR